MVPERFETLLAGQHTGVLTTVLPDGAPMGTPVWFLYRDGRILISTRADRHLSCRIT